MAHSPLPNIQQALGHDVTDKRLEVLRLIGLKGSISEAARQAGISYKAAWQAIDTLTNLSGVQLVEKVVGGTGGGGARLTDQGEALIAMADAMGQARAQVVARFAGVGALGQGLGMRTSMRNQVRAHVLDFASAHPGDPLGLVHLRTACGAHLCSAVTDESRELLGLAPALAVLVLCKATAVSVTLASDTAGKGVNRIDGVVERVSPGEQQHEVVLRTVSGELWVGFAKANEGVVSLGARVCASMPASALVIGLPA